MSTEIYKLIQLRGTDAGEFLQGQLTQDIGRVDQTGCLPAAWCNPKGRVITAVRVLTIADGYGLVLPESLAETVRQRLMIYRFRADVGIEITGPEWTHLVFRTDQDMDDLDAISLRPERKMNACRQAGGLTVVNIGIEESCIELFGFKADFENAAIDVVGHGDFEFLAGAKIRAGIPEIAEDTSEKYTPHMLNLDLLGAVSFEKGCYTGQEVVARTQNLGRSKRRLARYLASGQVNVGDRLSDRGTNVGDVINVSAYDVLAVTPLEFSDKSLSSNGAKLTPQPLPYEVPGINEPGA